jgi:uncharacterized protein
MNACRTSRNVLQVVVLMSACMAQLIPGATAQTNAPESVTNTTNEVSLLKKAGPPHDPYTTGIVTGDPNGTEFAAASEIATLIAAHQVTGPHGEVALRVTPMVSNGGLLSIRDLLTVAEADMSIVPVALLNRAGAMLGLDDVHEQIVYIAPLYEEEFHILTKWSIRSISDLAGKTVNLGTKNSAAAVLGGEIFQRLGLKVNVVNLDKRRAVDAMERGEIEADVVLSSKPADALASYTVEDTVKEGFQLMGIPYSPVLGEDFVPATLTYDDYPNLVFPGKSVNTIGVRLVLIAYNWPKGSDRYRLLDLFVRSLFSRLSELKADPHYPKWRDVNLTATLPGWSRFPPAQRWFDRQELESFLSKWGTGAETDRARLYRDFLRWREHSGGG